MSNPFMAIAQARLHKLAEDKRRREERDARKKGLLGSGLGMAAGLIVANAVAPGAGTALLMGASAGASLGGAIASEDPQAIAQAGMNAAATGVQLSSAAATAKHATATLGTEVSTADVLGGRLPTMQAIASLTHVRAQTKLLEEQTIAVARANRGLGNTTSDDGETAAAIKPTLTPLVEDMSNYKTSSDTPTPKKNPKQLGPMAVSGAPAPKRQTPFDKSFAENREKFNTNIAAYSSNARTPLSAEPQVPLARLLGDPR